MIGKSISHYKILEKLGEGGMGVVYKAQDTKLKRTVALKFLPPEMTRDPEAKKRFIHEAQAASALNHPNVCTIYEIHDEDNDPFIAMEYVAGNTLKDIIVGVGAKQSRDSYRKEGEIHTGIASPLRISDALEYAIQVAEALDAAHQKDVVHRDIKSANIMVTDKGQVKIMDFGLAKLSGQTVLTKEGSTLGTVAYMSPEQTEGKTVDHRSDIWALGVVLYEMITGRRPFQGDYDQSVMYSILNEDPEPVTGVRTGVPMELEQIVRKCLEKNPSDRYQGVNELMVDLRRIARISDKDVSSRDLQGTTVNPGKRILKLALPGIIIPIFLIVLIWFVFLRNGKTVSDADSKMLVVLPFVNMGLDEDAYFAVGITDEITGRLGMVPRVGVISRNSASHYAGKEWNTRQVGEDLNVEYIVAGTVRWARSTEDGDMVRITPRLIRVSDDIEIWAKSFDRVIHDIFEIQTEIAIQVVEQLGITLGSAEQRTIEKNATEHFEAYQAFLQGRHLSRSSHFTVDNWKRVIQSYQRAVALDPTYAVAYAELARAHARLHYLRHDLSEERLEMAKKAAAQAEELAPESPEVLLSLAYYYLWAYHDREQALRKWTLAEKGLPNDPRILEAKGNLCLNLGHWDEGIKALEKALRYSPRNVSLMTDLAVFYWMKRQYHEAIDLCNQAIALAPDGNWAYIFKSLIIWNSKGSNQESRHAIESVNQEYHWVPWLWFLQEVGEGKFSQALQRLDNNPDEWISHKIWARPKSMFQAFIYEFMGKTDQARESYHASVAPLEAMVRKWPDDPRYRSSLGIAYAALGRKEEAIREGKKAMELLPLSKDAQYGQAYIMDMIIIYIKTGDYDAALDKTEFLLSMPTWMSVGWLKFDLRYKPLYGDPKFKKLIKEYSKDMR